ncbi:hypothetical protein Scep_014104 [Stephania cephalantha]|uniref:Uncharacterized protein n=1 Tax=Stephania cephalantha TaxID=152367 RepID=A0AAP0P017_9MAGN
MGLSVTSHHTSSHTSHQTHPSSCYFVFFSQNKKKNFFSFLQKMDKRVRRGERKKKRERERKRERKRQQEKERWRELRRDDRGARTDRQRADGPAGAVARPEAAREREERRVAEADSGSSEVDRR